MIAALPMYDWPEERAATDAWYAALRARLPDLPAALTRDRDLHDLWRDPALVFGQACWGPLRAGLSAHLRVLAQPDYGDVPGGRGPFYRSAVVARTGAPATVPPGPGAALPALAGRLAFNERESLSGWLALAEDAGDPGGWAAALVETGSHRESVRAVAEGRADLAAIDARSWALALRHESCAAALVVVGWTAERPGLPYVTARATPPERVAALRAALIEMGAHPATEGT
jgi:ABC-type phosphate/phosphonate transport system substrate-binding protein